MEEKPNKVNTFRAAYYDATLASGLPEKTAVEEPMLFLNKLIGNL